MENDDDETCGKKAVEEHRVSGFCYRVASDEKYQTLPQVYSGKNVIDKFYEHVMKETEIIGEIVRQELVMSPLTPQQELDFQKLQHPILSDQPNSSTSLPHFRSIYIFLL